MWIYYASYIDHNCGNAVSLHIAFIAHLFTCSEQNNSLIMETPISDCLIPIHSEEFLDALIEDEQDDYTKVYLQWKKEHQMQSATSVPDWI